MVYDPLSSFTKELMNRVIEATHKYMPTTAVMEDLLLLDQRYWLKADDFEKKSGIANSLE